MYEGKTIDETLKKLSADGERGLREEDVKERQKHYGSNELEEKKQQQAEEQQRQVIAYHGLSNAPSDVLQLRRRVGVDGNGRRILAVKHLYLVGAGRPVPPGLGAVVLKGVQPRRRSGREPRSQRRRTQQSWTQRWTERSREPR